LIVPVRFRLDAPYKNDLAHLAKQPAGYGICLFSLPRLLAQRQADSSENTMRHFIAFSLCTMALAWTIPGQAQVSPAPEAGTPGAVSGGSAADTGATGNDGSAAGSDGSDSRSHRTQTSDWDEKKPKDGQIGDKTDFSGNEGADDSTEATNSGRGTGHSSATLDSGSPDSGASDGSSSPARGPSNDSGSTTGDKSDDASTRQN